jgi:PleD family two-component response regulator
MPHTPIPNTVNSKSPFLDAPVVLIADDENLIRMQVRRVMEQAGYRVVETSFACVCQRPTRYCLTRCHHA